MVIFRFTYCHIHIHKLMTEAAMRGANLLIRSNLGFRILLLDTLISSLGSRGTEPVIV